MLVHKSIRSALIEVRPCSSNFIWAKCNGYGNPCVASMYAFPTTRNRELREQIYDDVSQVISTWGHNTLYFIAGDSNAILQGVRAHESTHIGNHVLGRGLAYAYNAAQDTQANRYLFVQFLFKHDILFF